MRRGLGHAAGFGQGPSHALSTPRGRGGAPGLRHAPALALAAASLTCKRVHAQVCVTLTLTLTLPLTLTLTLALTLTRWAASYFVASRARARSTCARTGLRNPDPNPDPNPNPNPNPNQVGGKLCIGSERKLGEGPLTTVCALPHERLFCIGGEEATVAGGVNKRKFTNFPTSLSLLYTVGGEEVYRVEIDQLPHEHLFSIGGEEATAARQGVLNQRTVLYSTHFPTSSSSL